MLCVLKRTVLVVLGTERPEVVPRTGIYCICVAAQLDTAPDVALTLYSYTVLYCTRCGSRAPGRCAANPRTPRRATCPPSQIKSNSKINQFHLIIVIKLIQKMKVLYVHAIIYCKTAVGENTAVGEAMSLNEPIGLETRDHMITCCTVDRVATRATRARSCRREPVPPAHVLVVGPSIKTGGEGRNRTDG